MHKLERESQRGASSAILEHREEGFHAEGCSSTNKYQQAVARLAEEIHASLSLLKSTEAETGNRTITTEHLDRNVKA